jgi:two-component SAPR family response regulator
VWSCADPRASREIIELCTKAAVLDPYTEQLHVALIEALTAIGSYNEAWSTTRRHRHVLKISV